MPIRTVPVASITVGLVREMIAREIYEDRTLDFKQVLDLREESARIDLTEDVSAFANASGGMLLYGAIEGEGIERGRIVDIRGMHLAPDATDLQVKNLLRDNIDERIAGVETRAIPVGDDTYLYVIRVPASPRAPHMVTRGSKRSRFFMRGTVSNDPMNAQQIREVAMRSETAYDRARERIGQRIAAIDQFAVQRYNRLNTGADPTANADFVALHFIPLFPPIGGIDLSSQSLRNRWHQVSPFGFDGAVNLRMSFDGLSIEHMYRDGGAHAWTMLLRGGGIECVEIDNAIGKGRGNLGGLDAWAIETDVLKAIDEVVGLGAEGFINPPFALSLQLHHMRGLMAMATNTRLGNRNIEIDQAPIEPIVVSRWEDAKDAARGLFHVMWQSWGWHGSPWYDEQGTRREPQRR